MGGAAVSIVKSVTRLTWVGRCIYSEVCDRVDMGGAAVSIVKSVTGLTWVGPLYL